MLALSLCVSTLIASEFMPVSLLTPIATDLHLTDGMAGQAISVSGLFAVLTSLFIARATAGIDRRHLLLGLTLVMLLSGLMVSMAPNFAVLMAGRALLGVVIGGFWSMSAATVMRLVPANDVPRALALLNGGNAVATTVSAPLGSFLGLFIGWRWAFFIVVPLAALTFAWKWLTLPAMPSPRAAQGPDVFGVMRQTRVRTGMAAIALLFAGQFAVFTYLRPFLEQTTGVSVSTLSLILLAMGVAGVAGNALIRRCVAYSLALTLTGAPLIMAAVTLALIGAGRNAHETACLLTVWGLVGTALPAVWWIWLARTLPNDAEAGGGLMVAVIQSAITLGAAGGGLVFDSLGLRSTFLGGAALLFGSALIAAIGLGEPSSIPARSKA